MTHDELLTKIEKQTVHIANKIKPVADSCEKEIGEFANALRAVVELHQPQDITLPDGSWGENCCVCNNGWNYPCRTIQVIEQELN